MISVPFALTVASTALAAGSAIPYIVATVRRTTKPRIATWLTWSLLTAVAGAASASTGDYPSAAFSVVGAIVTAAVVVAGLRYGDRDIALLDAVCLALVAAGFVLWQTLDLPGVAVLAACVIDSVGLVPTLVHSWRKPHEETALTYLLIAAGGACAVLAAWGTWTVTALAYPVYVAVSMGVCWLIIVTRRQRRQVPIAVADVAPQIIRPSRPRKAAALNNRAQRRRARRQQQRQGRRTQRRER